MNNRTVIRRIKKIEDIIVPQPREDLVVVWSFGSEDEPHGKYGYRKYHNKTGEVEACTEDEEIELLRQAYYRIPPKVRKRVNYWASFEKFKEQHLFNNRLIDLDPEKQKDLEELNKDIIVASLCNFKDKIRRDIYRRIQIGEIEENESVRKILAMFDVDD